MSEQLEINGVKYLPAGQAGKAVGYSTDYITRLAREGKIAGEKVGRQWYVAPDSVKNFVEKTARQKVNRQLQLSAERRREHEELKGEALDDTMSVTSKGKVWALTQTLAMLIVGVAIGAANVHPGIFTQALKNQPALVAESGVSFNILEQAAISFYRFISPEYQKKYSASEGVFLDTRIDADASARVLPEQRSDSYGIISVTDEDYSVAKEVLNNAFSDEVDVSFDVESSESGTLTPRFTDRLGEPYRFLLVLNPKGDL